MNREQTDGELPCTIPACKVQPLLHYKFTSDLKAFEQRLMDCVAHVKGKAVKWTGGLSHANSADFTIYFPTLPSSNRYYFTVVWSICMDLVGR